MTVESSLSKVVFNGNGVTTEFPFTFKVWDVSEIAVTMANPQGYAEDVTAAAVITLDEDSGGAVTYLHEGAPLPEGWRLAITRNMPFLQRVDLVSATRFDPQVMEDALDQACAERQELREQLARAVIMPPTSETTPEEVVQSVYDARDAAAASATAASGSASEASGSAALAQAWAQSPTPPDAEDADSKSARTWAGLAADSADDAAASESNAAGSADRAQAWAESPTPPDPEDPDSKSAKEWALVAADSVPIATPTLAGKVKPDGATIEVAQDGGISVPAATTTDLGLARLATTAEVQAGAAAAGSPTPAVLRPEDIAAFPAVLGGAMMYNTRKVLTVSGSWTAPVTGWYKVTCIGGGGAGGHGGAEYGTGGYSGGGGAAGGTTSFGSFLSASGGGGGGGGGGTCSFPGGGGGAGFIRYDYIYITKNSSISYIIGAGAPRNTTTIAIPGNNETAIGGNGSGTGAGRGGTAWCAGMGAVGAGSGIYGSGNYSMHGGAGGSNASGYGGGGGGGGGNANSRTQAKGGVAIDGAEAGGNAPLGNYSRAGGYGGAGGKGAIIIEYFDPAKAA